jgi:UDP-N-acetylmuramyl pentapeptide phosphotransferase/UDP-N-acetylglucosamine-1-phosphate transferase
LPSQVPTTVAGGVHAATLALAQQVHPRPGRLAVAVGQHDELKGWSEVNVVIRFWIIAGMVAAIGLGIFYGDFLAATS